jgi:hypothetical protein
METTTDSPVKNPAKFSGADWLLQNKNWLLKNNKGKPVSELGLTVADILGQCFFGLYHIHKHVLNKKVDWTNNHWIEITISNTLSTFDDTSLTRLVLLCHHKAVRLEIGGAANGYLRLAFSQRKREGALWERHPSIQDQVVSMKDFVEAI